MFKSYDTISGKEGTAFVKINGNNEELFCATSIETKIELNKADVKCIGRRMSGSKATGMKGTGTLKVYYGYPVLANVVHEYKKTGKALYFDLVMTNDDPASSFGRQTVLLKDCMVDGITLAKLDGESDDPLSDDIGFTFEDYDIIENFKKI